MANSTVLVSAIGIVVSGVVGPGATAWATRRANRQQFERDRAGKRRDDLRELTDEGADMLALGAINLRRARESAQAHKDVPDDVNRWAETVFALQQRLRLRLPEEHAVVRRYGEVRQALVEVFQSGARLSPDSFEQTLERFETARNAFVDAARAELIAPIEDDD